MARNYIDPQKRKVYAHYKTAGIVPNTGSSDRRAYWHGRFGYPPTAEPNSMAYPIWAAGHDLFAEDGAPNIIVDTAMGALKPYKRP